MLDVFGDVAFVLDVQEVHVFLDPGLASTQLGVHTLCLFVVDSLGVH